LLDVRRAAYMDGYLFAHSVRARICILTACVLGCVQGWMRVTVQGEVIDSLFGLPTVASHTMERYTTSVLNATMTPPTDPTPDFRDIMQVFKSPGRHELNPEP
jgi:phosphoenolpyruvate carboxylase